VVYIFARHNVAHIECFKKVEALIFNFSSLNGFLFYGWILTEVNYLVKIIQNISYLNSSNYLVTNLKRSWMIVLSYQVQLYIISLMRTVWAGMRN